MKRTIFLALVMALFIVGCSQKEYYMPKAAPTKEGQFVNDMVKKCNGDPSKLSPEERKKMDTITRGMTDLVIKGGPPKQ